MPLPYIDIFNICLTVVSLLQPFLFYSQPYGKL